MAKMNYRESSRFHFQPILILISSGTSKPSTWKKLFFETGFHFKRKKQPVLRWFSVFALNFTKLEHHILVSKAFFINLLFVDQSWAFNTSVNTGGSSHFSHFKHAIQCFELRLGHWNHSETIGRKYYEVGCKVLSTPTKSRIIPCLILSSKL